jgi:hypothetical protein
VHTEIEMLLVFIFMYLNSSTGLIQCSVKFNVRSCKHKKGVLYRQTRGKTRKQLMESIAFPRHIAQHTLQKVSGQQLLTGNRQSIPSVQQARKIKQETRTTLNLAQRVMETITMLNRNNTKIWKAKNPFINQKLDGIIQDPVQLSPLCISIYNEPAVAFYHHFANSNPGVYLDYTGSLVRNTPKYFIEQTPDTDQLNTQKSQRVLNALMVMPTGDSRAEATAPVVEIIEIITSDLRASNLKFCLQKFRNAEERVFGHKTVPYLFNADCARNILVAVLEEYNNETTTQYLARIVDDLTNSRAHNPLKVQVAWCFSHAVKAVRNHLRATRFLCHPGVEKQFFVKAGVRLWNLVRVRKTLKTANDEARLWNHLLNQQELAFEDTILCLGNELVLMRTTEDFEDVYGENEDDQYKTAFDANILASDEEMNQDKWLVCQEIKDFNPMAFPQVTVNITTPPPQVTVDQAPNVNPSVTYTYQGKEVIKIVKHKTKDKIEYEFEFLTLSTTTRTVGSHGSQLINPLYSPEFFQYLQKC